MDITQYSEIDRIFGEVIDLPSEERPARIRSMTDDDGLIESVEALLDEHERLLNEPFLNGSALGNDLDWQERKSADLEAVVIGNYTILRFLGQGASGSVYLAQAPAPLERLVAVKLLKRGAGPKTVARFREEQRVLARLAHPGIARVLDEGVADDGRPYTVLEYIEGESITAYCQSHQLDWRAIAALIIQGCEAVAHAHQRNIIHRDLKPSNLLVTEADSGPQVKIIDFGIAKLTEPHIAMTTLTQGAAFMGTLAYASPEQIEGGAAPDTRSDVYALGLVLSECLTGDAPFGGDTEGLRATVDAIMTRPITPLTHKSGFPARELDAVLARACAKSPDDRYASPLHLGDDLHNLLSGLPVTAMRGQRAYAARKFIMRHRVVLGVTAAVLAVMVALAGLAIDRGLTATQQRDALRATAMQLVDDVLPQLADLSGATEAQRVLVSSLEERIDDLLETDPGDVALLERKARVLEIRSDMHIIDEQLGAALVLRQEALALVRKLLAGQSDQSEMLPAQERRLIIKIGDIAKVQKDWAVAWQHYEDAHLKLLNAPGDQRENLCWSYERLAVVARSQKRFEHALKYTTQRLDLALELYHERPDAIDHLHNCAQAYQFMARWCNTRGEHERGLEYAEQAVVFAHRMVHHAPDLYSSQCMMLDAYSALLICQYYLNRLAEGDATAEQIQQLIDALIDQNAMRADAQYFAWVKLRKVREWWVHLGRSEAAEEIRARMETLRPGVPVD